MPSYSKAIPTEHKCSLISPVRIKAQNSNHVIL